MEETVEGTRRLEGLIAVVAKMKAHMDKAMALMKDDASDLSIGHVNKRKSIARGIVDLRKMREMLNSYIKQLENVEDVYGEMIIKSLEKTNENHVAYGDLGRFAINERVTKTIEDVEIFNESVQKYVESGKLTLVEALSLKQNKLSKEYAYQTEENNLQFEGTKEFTKRILSVTKP